MSESIAKPEESPDFFEQPTKSWGGKRLNLRIVYFLAGTAMFILSAFGVASYVRGEQRATDRAASEIPNVSTVAQPPIKRPDGPDVNLPVTPQPVYVEGQPYAPSGPMQEPEWAKRQREARMQAYQTALTSELGVMNTWAANKSNNPQSGYPGRVPMPQVNGTIPPPPPYRGEDGEMMDDNNPAEAAQQRAFLAAIDPNASTYLKQSKNPPISPYEIKAGTVIPGVMITGVNSGLPGQITGQVKQDVYDTATGQHLLIPSVARLVGTYDSAINGGQESIFVAWNRIVFPDGSSISLEGMPGAGQSGLAGFKDQVNNHYVRTFGQAFLLSLFSAGIQLSQPRGAVQGTYNAQQIGAAAIGQQLGQLGMQIARRNLNMQPTLEIRPGFEFTIAVNKDMVFEGPWRGHSMAGSQ